MLTATLRLFSEESGSSDYSPKTAETIAEIRIVGQYNGGISYKQQVSSYKARRMLRQFPEALPAIIAKLKP